ncbi:hypothetical protein SEVIR_3G401200v4 [Setaria viridis]|uniref:Uncharacterized protein n=1 Tax=Setaria viridis TaxID=4556 RepID=A0A4U6VL31_SETVI|nr:translation initiation factor IF-2-like [Setaria viridis]TKW29525.1 hypothetical protein SEVIR_3G401200v2 [Setaria viridis]
MAHHHRRCRPVMTVAAALCLVVLTLGGRCGAAARPLRRLHAAEGSTEPALASEAAEAVLDVAAAEAPEAAAMLAAGGGGEGQGGLGEGKWLPLPMPMPMSMPAASALAGGLRFPPVPVPFPLAGASMPWLPGAPPAFAGVPALVPPYVGATRQEQLSLWASLFNPFQVRPRLPGALGGETTTAGAVERGGPAIAGAGKAAEGETMDVPAAGAVQVPEPKWGVFLGNIDRRN